MNGSLHRHSTWRDWHDTVETMAKAAIARELSAGETHLGERA